MTLQKPRAVIFDWDDTLVDTWHAALKALNTALVSMGQNAWTEEEARSRAGRSARDLFKDLFGEKWEEADKIYYATFTSIVLDNIRVHDDVEEILRALTDEGVYLAVVSNKRGPLLRKEADHLNFTRYFNKIVGAGDAAADKPDPAPVLLALKGSGIDPGPDVWFIGDSHVDMLCARNAGCTGILIETKPPSDELLIQNPPAKRFKKHSNFMEFIGGYFN